jgi:hypothetical protein
MCIKRQQYKKQQRGFVLILALVLLAVMTLIGVSSMNSANMELKATANAKQHQVAFNAVQSLLEFMISKPGTGIIDYQTSDLVPQVYSAFAIAGGSKLTGTVNYLGCAKGTGGSLEAGKGFSYNFYNVQGSGSNATNTAISNQTLGVRFPSAC